MTETETSDNTGRKAPEGRKKPPALPIAVDAGFRPSGNPSLPTFVGLMLIVTTFMIELTSISLDDAARMHDLFASMRETFGRSERSAIVSPNAPAAPANLMKDAASGFRAAVPATLPNVVSGSDNLTMSVPLGAVFAGDVVRDDFGDGLQAIADAFETLPPGFRYQIELRFPTGKVTSVAAGALAEAAVKAGLRTDSLYLATGFGMADELYLRIRMLAPEAGGVEAGAPESGEAP